MIRQWVARPPRALPTHGGRDFATATAQAHCGARLAQRGAGGAACWEAARWRALRVCLRRRAPPPSESCARTRGTPSWRPLGCSSPTRTTSCGERRPVRSPSSPFPHTHRHRVAAGAVADVQMVDGCRISPAWCG